jgi:aspartate/methionine/tyrosine aminotransferase
MIFSRRTAWDLAENDLTTTLRAHRAAGRALLDLTVSNPTLCGFAYDEASLLAPLAAPQALHYDPAPLGIASARAAVAAYYADHAATVPLDRICLTTSTSEAYSFLFRLLCDPGDEVLIARPSYPLFNFIAQLDDVSLREYPLFYDPGAGPQSDHSSDHGWSIDLHALTESIGPRTRAIVVVHPNNPTGNLVAAREREALEQLCAVRGLALIADEVFLDYTLSPTPPQTFAAGRPHCLTFTLSGISKICGLPQMKASWLVCSGPSDLAAAAMARIEVIADTFLSMNAPVQQALPAWLAGRHALQRQIRDRMVQNLDTLDLRLTGTAAQRLAMQGGWTVVLRVPRTGTAFHEAALAQGVLVQPGDFYGLPEGRAVLSLLTPPDIWRAGIDQIPLA